MNKIIFLPNEEWITLQFENRKGSLQYAVSNYGRVVSYHTEIEYGKLLPLDIEPTRHTRIKVEFLDGSKSVYIHTIVAENFVPKPEDPEKEYVIHLNKDIKDDHYLNLKWGDYAEYKQSMYEASQIRKSVKAGNGGVYKPNRIKLFIGEEAKEVDVVAPSQKRYSITSFGRLISYYDKLENGLVLKTGSHTQGYRIWHFKDDTGQTKSYLIHRLVAEYFLPQATPEQDYVIHKDHNRINNVVSNLEWATKEEYTAHVNSSQEVIDRKDKHKRRSQITGRGAKLTVGKVKLIKKILNDPKRTTRLKMIAKQFGISSMQLYRIQTGENWGWLNVDENGNEIKDPATKKGRGRPRKHPLPTPPASAAPSAPVSSLEDELAELKADAENEVED